MLRCPSGVYDVQARLLVQDCAEKLEKSTLKAAIQEVSMIKVSDGSKRSLCFPEVRW